MKSVYKTLPCFLFAVFLFVLCSAFTKAAPGYYYEIKIYHLKTQAQEDRLDSYLQNAYIPAMHRMGFLHIGVFKPVTLDTAARLVYVLTPYSTFDHLEKAKELLSKDTQYAVDGKDYIDAAYNDLYYSRFETILLKAFPKMLMPAVPDLSATKMDRVYELRSYESPSENFNVNKVKMFNDGNEVALFKRLGFNAVFYAEVIAGSHMPNLMYMTTFNNRADRDKHWDAFNNDPEWKTLVAKPEYQHNVSKADIIFLHPTVYSDF